MEPFVPLWAEPHPWVTTECKQMLLKMHRNPAMPVPLHLGRLYQLICLSGTFLPELFRWGFCLPRPQVNSPFCDLPSGPVAKTACCLCRGLGSIPGQGTRCHMPQLRPGTAKLKKKKKKKGSFLQETFYDPPKAAYPLSPTIHSLTHFTLDTQQCYTSLKWYWSWPVWNFSPSTGRRKALWTWALWNLFTAEFPVLASSWAEAQKRLWNEVTNNESTNPSSFSAPQTATYTMQGLPWKWLNRILNWENIALCNSSPDSFEQLMSKSMYVLNVCVYMCLCVCIYVCHTYMYKEYDHTVLE